MKRLILLILIVFLLFYLGCRKLNSPEYNVDAQSCNGCGRCIQICPVDAIEFDADGNATIDQTKCNQCGQCITICPQGAVH
ncbi:MAG: 4Fe-4S binding protein [Candidatus Cloacimonetes bacterium]|nr:4Fe-4S binding protein [Candidatus Cloacimonadota bacterium]